MMHTADIETIECIRHPDGQRFENLLASGLVIAEREMGAVVWLEVFEDQLDHLPDCADCGAPRRMCACRVPARAN